MGRYRSMTEKKPKYSLDHELKIRVVDSRRIPGAVRRNDEPDYPQYKGVVDTSYHHVHHMRSAIRKDLEAGRIVILAWCYSICTFYEEPELTTEENEEKNMAMIQRPVCDIVKEYFTKPDRKCLAQKQESSRSSNRKSRSRSTGPSWRKSLPSRTKRSRSAGGSGGSRHSPS